MSSRLMVNLIEPSEIVIPDTDGSGTPDTGIFSIGQGTNNVQNSNALIITVISLAVLLAIVAVAILLIKRHKKQKLVNNLGSSYNGMTLNTKRHLVPRLAGLFVLVLIAVFGFLNYNEKHMTNNVEAASDTLTVTTEDITAIDIEIDDEAVFGVGESKVTVDAATDNGYTLMAYVDSTTTSLTNSDSNDTIAMLETSYSQALTDNTWGTAFTKPESQEQTIFRGLPTTEDDAMVVKVSGSDATEANDETTLYYGTYVTPDLDYGTYDGVTINYVAVAHVIDTDDVTVRYHGNGLYFDEAKTKDTNTVVYGESCEMTYVGGNCARVYTTEQPYTIVKTPNINDDGTQNGSYPIDEHEPIVYQSVSIPGADAIKIEVDYAISTQQYSVYLNVARGELNYDNFEYEAEIYTSSNYTAGEETYIFDSDAVTILFRAKSEPLEGYDYGFYARIYPIYYEQPDGVNSIEDTLCYIAKSKNIDDGNATGLYEYEDWITKPITIRGAKQIRVVMDYALTDEAEVLVYDFDSEVDLYTDGENISGTEEYVFNGDTVTFEYGFWDEPLEDYGYGFFARLYPVYGEEHEGTAPAQNCAFSAKDGMFEEVVAPDGYPYPFSYKRWYLIVEIEGEDYYGQPWWFRSENEVLDYIKGHIDFYSGRTVDIYAGSFYLIVYDGNGGISDWGSAWEQQGIGKFDSSGIWDCDYYKDNYDFIGWNTMPDGSGDWYYPGDPISSEGHLGETLTLYAQWGFTLSISDLTYMQDFATLSSVENVAVLNTMVLNQQYELKDSRDNKIYTVAKLTDGNVWMTQNLDLDIDSNRTYTNRDTDLGYNTETQQYVTAAWKPVRSTYSMGDNTWGNSYSTPESYDPGDLCWNGEIAPDYNGTLNDYAVACGSEKHYHIGNYYNFAAAVAMNDSSSYTANHTDVNQSICPAGWRLPVLTGNKSYKDLIEKYNLTSGASGNIQNAPLYFTYAGSRSGGTGSWGGYWPSSISSDTGAWAFEFSRDEGVSFGTEFYRFAGLSVRCVAR